MLRRSIREAEILGVEAKAAFRLRNVRRSEEAAATRPPCGLVARGNTAGSHKCKGSLAILATSEDQKRFETEAASGADEPAESR